MSFTRRGLKRCPGHPKIRYYITYGRDGKCPKCGFYLGSVRSLPKDTSSFEVRRDVNGRTIIDYDCGDEPGSYLYKFDGDKIVENVCD